MDVLLAEADVPCNEVFELEEINHDFASIDVAFVIGANDVTDPATKDRPLPAKRREVIVDAVNCLISNTGAAA
jgi:H+-translocating NAD(P) transhydrogenase subunit beta